MNNQNLSALALFMALCLLALSGQPQVQSEVPIQFTPPHAAQAWDEALANAVVAATQIMVAQMEVGDAEVRAWVARVPGDPPPAGS
ncbi:MAG: hypothetical protein JJT88_04065 [Gammaproteobacteria bacterium]|nr:hypothetical protein [Gammaproteobacteria bacterium]